MKHVSLQVTACSPLAIRSDHAEGGASTARNIPGATLLGSLAAAHRILHPKQEDEFTSFFLKEQVYFPYLYPALFKEVDMQKSGLPILPLPKTAQSCKRFPGFLPLSDEDADEEQHGIRDTLLDWAVFSLLDRQREQHDMLTLLAPFEPHKLCIHCKQVMDHESGYYRRDRFDPQQRAKAQVHTRLQTHTGINRDWGVVEDGILYNREVFDEGMRFWGEVVLPDEIADSLIAFVKEANDENVIRIGTGRTRGLGCVEVEARPMSRESFAHFTERLSDFNATLQHRAEKAHVAHLDPLAFYFALTLYTPTILCDPFLRYYKTIDGKTLSNLLGPSNNTFTRMYQSVGVQLITGWNELWGTPRTNDYAMEIGSTFLFACASEPDSDLRKKLYQLEEMGIGRRRTEGFGRIRISDPFHLEGEQS